MEIFLIAKTLTSVEFWITFIAVTKLLKLKYIAQLSIVLYFIFVLF